MAAYTGAKSSWFPSSVSENARASGAGKKMFPWKRRAGKWVSACNVHVRIQAFKGESDVPAGLLWAIR